MLRAFLGRAPFRNSPRRSCHLPRGLRSSFPSSRCPPCAARQSTALLSPQYLCLWNHCTPVCSFLLSRSPSGITLCIIGLITPFELFRGPCLYLSGREPYFLTSFISTSKIRTISAYIGLLHNKLLQQMYPFLHMFL